MRKLIAVLTLLVAGAVYAPAATKTSVSSDLAAGPQTNRQWRQNRRRQPRVVTSTRIVRVGYRRYREVVQYKYLPNGRVTVRVLSRTRIR